MGRAWRVSGNLKSITIDIKALRPHATVYSIGDLKHMAKTSDHNIDSRGVVCAIDVMIRNGFTKRDANNLVKLLRGRSDLQYIIYNRTIWSASWGWKARKYTGSDPHTDHVHVSSKHSSAADKARTVVKWAGTSSAPYVNVGGGSTKPLVKPTSPKPSSRVVLAKAPKWPLSSDAAFHPYFNRTPPVYETMRAFQQQLKDRGWRISVDGRYGPQTHKVVIAFQKQKGLKADGLVGPKTWNAAFTAKLTSA